MSGSVWVQSHPRTRGRKQSSSLKWLWYQNLSFEHCIQQFRMLGPQLSNGWRGHSAELSLLETELLFFRLSTFPQTTQGLREHCWPTADLLTCHSAPLCLPSSLFELIKILCFLRFRSLHAPLIFIFLTKSEWVDKCFIKLVLIPLNVSSLSSPWEYKLHQERVFFPLVSPVCRTVPSTTRAASPCCPNLPVFPGLEFAWGHLSLSEETRAL